MTPTENESLAPMESSCEEQFVALLSACQTRPYCFVAGLVINHADAEELFQQAKRPGSTVDILELNGSVLSVARPAPSRHLV